ncbi:DUF2007 domain-containing protein [bacterium]|nr:DUF2007 domain-containing protein [bacterium]
MINIYSHQNSTSVYLMKNVLENFDIQCEIRNEALASVVGQYNPFNTWIELWIMDDAKYDEAQKILKEALSDEGTKGEPWKCSKCGEEN